MKYFVTGATGVKNQTRCPQNDLLRRVHTHFGYEPF